MKVSRGVAVNVAAVRSASKEPIVDSNTRCAVYILQFRDSVGFGKVSSLTCLSYGMHVMLNSS